MREIKFRAWNITQNKMEIPFSIYDIKDDYWDNNTKNKIFLQFTGLLDKNGKEIYEGDIYSNGEIRILYVVEWFDSGFMGRNIRTRGSRVGLEYWQANTEIMGNIYENPDLLSKPQQ